MLVGDGEPAGRAAVGGLHMLFGIDLPDLMHLPSPAFLRLGRLRSSACQAAILEPGLHRAHARHPASSIALGQHATTYRWFATSNGQNGNVN